MEPKAKRIAFATLFGAIIFISKIVLPSPLDKMFIGVQAAFLALGALLLRTMGATYIAVIGGSLTVLWRISFAPFTFFFDLLYGLLVDIFFLFFKANATERDIKTNRLVVSMTITTALMGFTSYYTTVYLFNLLPTNLLLEFAMLVVGTLNGLIAGHIASTIWNRYPQNTIRKLLEIKYIPSTRRPKKLGSQMVLFERPSRIGEEPSELDMLHQ